MTSGGKGLQRLKEVEKRLTSGGKGLQRLKEVEKGELRLTKVDGG